MVANEGDGNYKHIRDAFLAQIRNSGSRGRRKPSFGANLALERKHVLFISPSLRHYKFHRFADLLGIWIATFYHVEWRSVRGKEKKYFLRIVEACKPLVNTSIQGLDVFFVPIIFSNSAIFEMCFLTFRYAIPFVEARTR